MQKYIFAILVAMLASTIGFPASTIQRVAAGKRKTDGRKTRKQKLEISCAIFVIYLRNLVRCADLTNESSDFGERFGVQFGGKTAANLLVEKCSAA